MPINATPGFLRSGDLRRRTHVRTLTHVSERTATPQAPPTGAVQLRVAEFDRITEKLGLSNDTERAKAIGVSHTTISRLRSGKLRPGGKFIALTLTALNVRFEDVFERRAA
ncbi:helix-turn-helix domain-containing protein [Micromonospora aurantiaca (nom. illeg.)]|uniref:helix-turn-helix transcriptional regulator n=1 Tax=Micromonospora aurantiaca (nom. illeg.) TaxID=47850 RepID=UPI001656F952|nr:helix-turn-helix transcriptional regulator [Micromonospora aurantiaca]MBC9001316.1 helix-turn-helix transcriptional regulator [Micromonospora aurantiaca]